MSTRIDTVEGLLNRTCTSQELARNVVRVLANYPHGLTSAEIAAVIGIKRDSVSPRMKALEDRGLIERTGLRRARKTVWRLQR